MGDQPEAELQRGLRLAIVAIAMAQLVALSLPALVVHAAAYRFLALEIVAFVLVAAVIAGVGVAVGTGHRLGRGRWFLLGVLAVAAAMALVGLPLRLLTEGAEWSFGVVCWAGLLLLLDYGFAAVVLFLGTHLAARLALLATTGAESTAVAGALVFTAGFLCCQVAVTLGATLLGRLARVVAEAARAEERLRTAEEVATRLHHDRRERYAGLDIVSLLTGLGRGELDPADDRVRTRCAVAAGRMRRLFAEQDDVPDPLVHALRACADSAERRGVTVYLGTCGARPEPPLPVRRALTEPVLALLATARAQARITVVGSPTTVTVSVLTDGDPPAEIPATDGVAYMSMSRDGRHWVEATWRN